MFQTCGNSSTRKPRPEFKKTVTNLAEWRRAGDSVETTGRCKEFRIFWLIDRLVGMATGCCGVKKQKVTTTVIVPRHGERTLSRSFITRSSNGIDIQNGESSLSSNYCQQTMSPRAVGRQPRIVCIEMVVFCFDVLYGYLNSTEPPRTPKFTNDQFPLFVTWKMGKDKKLRGCIGTFNSTSLHDGLREYAITSACKDSRFEPIHVDEFARLHCSVSLLMDFEVAGHYLDWEIGVHGIRIEFLSEKGSKKAATYLPEVATEQGWNQVQTIDSLLRKGGFKGTITPEIRGNICLIRFQSEKLTVSYSEYLSHKKFQADLVYQNHTGPSTTATTVLPALKSPIFNGEARNFMNGSLRTITTSPSSPGGGDNHRLSFTRKHANDHGNCQHTFNGHHHQFSTPNHGWRNHQMNGPYPINSQQRPSTGDHFAAHQPSVLPPSLR